jgi:hypothetical protein
MRTEQVYCSGCGHDVQLVFTDHTSQGGHANLRTDVEIVCVDYEVGCSHIKCLATGKAGIIMGVRLAKSHLNDDRFRVIHGRCDCCGQVSDLEILDETYAMCVLCEGTNRWATLKSDDGSEAVATGS